MSSNVLLPSVAAGLALVVGGGYAGYYHDLGSRIANKSEAAPFIETMYKEGDYGPVTFEKDGRKITVAGKQYTYDYYSTTASPDPSMPKGLPPVAHKGQICSVYWMASGEGGPLPQPDTGRFPADAYFGQCRMEVLQYRLNLKDTTPQRPARALAVPYPHQLKS